VTDPRRFEPLPWQLAPWKDTSRTLVISSGAGTGKSWMALHKMNAFCLRFPDALGLATRKFAESLKNSIIPTLETITPQSVVHVPSKSRFEYPNGSVIVYGGMKDKKQREKIRSVANKTSGVDIALMEEGSGFEEDDFEELGGRMRGTAAPWTQIMLITNPDAETHWINQKLIRPFMSGNSRALSCYFPKCEDNPTLPPEYMERLRALTGVRRARLYEGRWVRAEGTIYADSWDASKHIVPWFPIPEDWRRFRTIDFGFVHARVCLWIAVDPDGGMWVYRQIYKTKQRATEFAQEIIRRSRGERIEVTICDHDQAERADLEAEGIATIPALKGPGSVSRGIQAVEQRLIGSGNGPRLHFLRGSLVEQDDTLRADHKPCSTEEEFDVYVWARKPDGSVNKEEPKKENDDGMDALRYGVVYEDKDCLDPAGDDKDMMVRTVQAARASLGGTPQRTPGFGGGRGSRWL
jgi:phage terminase large subunit